MAAGQREFLAGLSTPTKAYNGDFLGPTLVVRTGSNVALNVQPMAHPFHVHGDSFQILSRDGVTPPDHELASGRSEQRDEVRHAETAYQLISGPAAPTDILDRLADWLGN